MPSRVSPSVEVFLLVEQPRQRLSHWSRALAPLDETGAPPLVSVDAFYEPSTNQAIFGLRYDPVALGPERLKRVVEVARLAELSMILPAELSDGDRRRFVSERLGKCALRVKGERKVVNALIELVRQVRGQKSTTHPPFGAGVMGAGRQARGTTNPARLPSERLPSERLPSERLPSERLPSERLPAQRSMTERSDAAILLAKGTRENDAEPQLARASRDLAKGSVRQRQVTAEADGDVSVVYAEPEPGAPNLPGSSASSRAVTSSTSPTSQMSTSPTSRMSATFAAVEAEIDEPIADEVTTAMNAPTRPLAAALPQRRDDGPKPSPNVVSRSGVHRANTVTMSALEASRMIQAARPSSPLLQAGAPVDPIDPLASTRRTERFIEDPDDSAARLIDEPGTITARYLRGGRWVPIRVGALSLRGATLMAGALPRLDDHVDVVLSYSGHRSIVRGAVTKVSTRQEAATSGAATFTVSFELDEASRKQLTQLLTAARAANVTIKPPPSRSTRRYPVEWPLSLGTERGSVRADALDVSADGMFVRPSHALALDAVLAFSAVLDDGQSPVTGRSRVVRAISDSDAQIAGLLPGYGLSIVEMAEPDRARWSAFLARIEKRAGRRVLIGASPERLAELQSGLVSAGYAVTGGIDAGAIAQLASADARPVDAALIDAAWVASAESASWVESLFSARNVPCVTIHGDARRARIAIDRLLSVA